MRDVQLDEAATPRLVRGGGARRRAAHLFRRHPLRWAVMLAPLPMAVALGAGLPRMGAEGAPGLLIVFAVIGLAIAGLLNLFLRATGLHRLV
jgi:FtsH-binding integral membrane protein